MESWLDPIFDADGMRGADSWAIETEGVPSLELMEAAGAAIADAVAGLNPAGPVRIVCGKGNNGGDGLVAARLLAASGHEVETLLLWPAEESSADSKANLDRLDGGAAELSGDPAAALEGSGAVVDAIFGTGFEGAPRAPAEAAIAAINGCGAPVVAADIASGLDASTGEVAGAAVRADVTVTFHGAKLGHWISPGKDRSGELRVAPIGIPPGAPEPKAAGLISDRVLALAPGREPGSTKFTSGEVLIVGGSRGLTGAVVLSASSAVRSGAGYATVAVPADLEDIFEIKLTEVMSRGFGGAEGHLAAADADAIVSASERSAAVVCGPGLGGDEDALELARRVAARVDAPLVLDADGLNAHAGRLGDLGSRDAPTVITPHAGELGRLLERSSAEIAAHRLESAREAARLSGAVVVLKGDDTIVAEGDRLAIARGGAEALATAGTGDVLSGLIAALAARGLEPFEAACAGVHSHQRAGRIAAQRVGSSASVIATDVIDALPEALG